MEPPSFSHLWWPRPRLWLQSNRHTLMGPFCQVGPTTCLGPVHVYVLTHYLVAYYWWHTCLFYVINMNSPISPYKEISDRSNTPPHIGAHIDFLQNCHQFWWFPWIFANFGDFFIESFSDSLNFHQNWWQKKTKSEGIIVTRIGDIFVTQKLTNFFKSPKCSPKLVKIQ